MLFTYLHLAADRVQAEALLRSQCVAIAYETVTRRRRLIAAADADERGRRTHGGTGRCAVSAAGNGGRGVLLGGVAGVAPAKVVVIGAGVAGTNALEMAHGPAGRGHRHRPLDLDRLRQIDAQFQRRGAHTVSTADAIERAVADADLVIGAVLLPGAAAPKLVTAAMIKRMQPGSVVVDIAIDQGGCFETSRPTTHADRRPIWSTGSFTTA